MTRTRRLRREIGKLTDKIEYVGKSLARWTPERRATRFGQNLAGAYADMIEERDQLVAQLEAHLASRPAAMA